jgi:protein tyrosine phosphatase (PTP) superfamily phosphohydrolase (DUF442 family)
VAWHRSDEETTTPASEIAQWRRIDARITTSGQPTVEQLADIAALGVRHVVDLALHTHEKALPDERATVAALGMRYSHIPVEFAAPTEEDFDRFCAVMAGTEPVHVHCIVNARVSAFVYRYRRDVLGVDEEQAREALEAIWTPEGVWADFIASARSAAGPVDD